MFTDSRCRGYLIQGVKYLHVVNFFPWILSSNTQLLSFPTDEVDGKYMGMRTLLLSFFLVGDTMSCSE